MVYEYAWKPNMPYKMPVSADVAGETLENLEKQHGEVTPKIVLDASRDENAPLHKCFEWDDGIAAEKYRERQAGFIIRSVVVVVEKPNTESRLIRAMVNVAPANQRQGSFISTLVAMQNPLTRNQILINALSELKAFQLKYAVFEELSEVFKSIDRFAKEQNNEKTPR